ncbi:terpene cyclase/mutase family protein [Candidatus Nomurabacteria bacterium]|nr:terpene cyclase/mutase family protein [Candidatus Nomurabacteria bacterium]
MKNKSILAIAFISFGLFFTNVVFADTNINLQIKNNNQTIYEGDINVAPCDSEGDGVLKATPYCAIVQSGTASVWNGLWVDSIGGVINNDGGNGIYWMWLANLSIDNCPTCSYSLSGKQYTLQNNDKILFYYNTNPLDITVDKQNPKVGENIKITGKELGLDSSWNPVWNKALSGKAIINGTSHDLDADGEFLYQVTSSDAFSVKIQKSNFIDSKELSIKPEEVKQSSGSSGSYINNSIKLIEVKKVFSIDNALKFLEQNQKIDGSFGEPLYTDWAALAAVAGDRDVIKEKLIKYYKENDLESNLVTDNERRAMTLMALGINPYTDTRINYIKKIVESFDGTQFGDKNIENDDIFALIVLKNAGYNENDGIINKDIKYLISKQSKDGSWGSIDMTAAYIEAMKGFEGIPLVKESVVKSKDYILSNQKANGGFENSSSTSWVLQSMYDNEKILNGIDYLTSKQEIDGGLEKAETNISTRIWGTSYAIPAILHKSWGEILNKFPKQESVISTIKTDEVINKNLKVKKTELSQSTNKETAKNNLDLIQQDIVKKVSFPSKLNTFWSNTKYSFKWLFNKLSF